MSESHDPVVLSFWTGIIDSEISYKNLSCALADFSNVHMILLCACYFFAVCEC